MDVFGAIREMHGEARKRAVAAVRSFHWLYPIALEAEYAKMLSEYMVAQVNDRIADVSTMLSYRGDASESEFEPDMAVLVAFGNSVASFTESQWAALLINGIGVAYDMASPEIAAVVTRWAETQLALISKADDDMRDKVWARVSKGVREGWQTATIREQLMEDMPGITERRAKLIARDQVSKLRSMLSRHCMESSGFQTYEWSTSNDERVRESHSMMEGRICRWDDETVCMGESGWEPRPAGAVMLHPGMDIQCRCVAAVNVTELDELDNDFEE